MGSRKHTPTSEQFTAFQKQFDHFNRALFGGRLPAVLLNFSRKANTYGFFAPERWKNADGTSTHEISLNPAYLAERAPEATSSTIVHEMAHLWQHEHGTPSRRGYHNEQWAVKMRELGLMPSSTGKPGGEWVGYAVSHYIIDGGRFERAFRDMPKEFLFPWQSWEPTTRAGKAKKAERNRIKYTCPTCAQNVWGKPGLHLVCGDDEAEYQPQEPGPGLPTKVERGPVWMPGVTPPERNGARYRHELERIVRSRPHVGSTCRAARSELRLPGR
jgi:predicted SprT family Zn-dependent metalloprotease